MAVLGIAVGAQFAATALAAAPGATTGAASNVTSSSAHLAGAVNPNGDSTTYAFQFGTTTAYGSQTNSQPAGSGTTEQDVSANVTGLRSGTTYHYRLVATNTSGTTVGSDQTFATSGAPPPPPKQPPPTVSTRAATGVGTSGATARGTVNPRGAKTTYYFQLGLTAAYGAQSTPKSLSAGSSSVSVSTRLSGLASQTTYHYRVVARNAGGTSIGSDRTFTTKAPRKPTRAVPAVTSNVSPKRDRRRPFRFKVRGKIVSATAASRSAVCRGRVTIRFRSRGKTLAVRRARVRSSCTYRATVRVAVRPRRKLRVTIRFGGNSVLKPRSAPARTVRAG